MTHTVSALFPEIEPYHTFYLDVSPIHSIYIEECGNPNGYPVLFLHGGPGGHITPTSRRFFDPAYYRIILFDQRGSGKSTPHACLEENTTQHLIQDMEAIRTTLSIEKWLLFGGSWGTTLALSYAITHPHRVAGLILRGIFLGRQEDIQWLFQKGASEFFPEKWEAYTSIIPEEERDDFIQAYYKRLTSPDLNERQQAAIAWSNWEDGIVTLLPQPTPELSEQSILHALSIARLECHYFYHHMFQEDDQFILNHLSTIEHIPTIIVHGRYDVDCRPIGAWLVHQHLPKSTLHMVADAGHSTIEPGILSALVNATQQFKTTLVNPSST